MNNKLIKPIIMDNSTNGMDYNYNVTVRRPSTLDFIGVSGYFCMFKNRLFCAIDENGVTVTFADLEEALEGVVVTVVDPEGNEVEVEAQDL